MLTQCRLIGAARREKTALKAGIVGAEALNPLPSAARLRGFEEDLGLTGSQFASVLSIFYVGYITMQVPSYVFCSWPRVDQALTSPP